jgi:hypothetical protein
VIAFYKEVETKAPPAGMRRARRLVASTLLRSAREPRDDAPPMPGWKAWLYCAWVLVAAAYYIGCMVGWL